ncbi:MAG: cytochrome P450 [Anaerolineales bacterium]
MTSRTPPGPSGRDLLNDLRDLQNNPLSVLLRSTRKYGDFVRLTIGPWNIYLVNHPEHIQQVLQSNNRNYTKDTFQYNMLRTVTGNGLLTSDGPFWLRQRRLVQPAFHRQRILEFGGIITDATQKMLESWKRGASSIAHVDIDAEMMRLTLEIIGKALFSVDLSGEAGEITQAVLTALDHIIYRSRHPFSPPLSVPTQRNRRFKEAMRRLDQAVYAIIQQRRPKSLPNAQVDLLSILLQARDEKTGEAMDDRQLRDEVITLIIAGHETVASALTWTWHLLSDHPEIEEKMHEELTRVLSGRIPTSADLPQLSFTRMVFQEALRLYPPAWIITRKTLKDDEFAVLGSDRERYLVPSGSLVVISPYSVHRHPRFWEQPEAFSPERFSAGGSTQQPRFAYLPFGGGPRMCIGDGFAKVEAVLILATIAQQYRFQEIPDHPVEVEPLVTLRPRNGLQMALHIR